MTAKEELDIIKQRVNTIRLNTKIGSRTIADKENAVLLDHIEYNLNKLCELVERNTPIPIITVVYQFGVDYHCPKCKEYIDVGSANDVSQSSPYNYCPYCGQRLEWVE